MSEQTKAYDMEVFDMPDFDFDGYQVVRGEFFAHLHEPSITFNNYKVGMNTACVKKLPDCNYVQVLVNPKQKRLVVKPCREHEKDSFRWCTSTDKRAPRQITCRMFFAKVISLMEWNPNCRYKLLGKLIKSGSDFLFLFDLTNVETFERTIKDDGKSAASKIPIYPESWKNQFGVPYNEHKESMQVNFFDDDLAIFKLQKDQRTSAAASTGSTPANVPADNPAPDEKENSYEQISLNDTI